jgi:hypothetical protein
VQSLLNNHAVSGNFHILILKTALAASSISARFSDLSTNLNQFFAFFHKPTKDCPLGCV